MNPYPEALTKRILEVYREGGGSMEEVAARFLVHRNTVYNLTKRFRSTGTLAPLPHGGGPDPLLTPEVLAHLQELVDQKNDRTQAEMAEQMKGSFGIAISRRSVSRGLQRLHITRKKKRFMPTSETDRM